MKDGFVKAAAAVPEVRVADPAGNAEEIIRLMEAAYTAGTAVVCFPELCVSGYTCGDLFFTEKLLRETEEALCRIAAAAAGKKMLVFVGAPVRYCGKLYNCAVALSDGEILGVTPKTCLPGYGEFGETRYFTPWQDGMDGSVTIGCHRIAISAGQIYVCTEMPSLRVGCVLGEELWACPSPAEAMTAMGANVIVHLSASPETVGRDQFRRTMVQAASGKMLCGLVSTNAGIGESTTDAVFAGHAMIASNGTLLAENPPFGSAKLIYAVADLQHLDHDRMRMNTFVREPAYTARAFSLDLRETDLTGVILPRPFLPADENNIPAACSRILEIQAHGLARRLSAAHASGAVIALSGGLDSTLALIVTVRAMDILGWDREKILSVTMPCFGTTGRTRTNAEELAAQFGTAFRCIDIKEAVDVHFRDIGHDPASLTVVYENAQARERTQIIMDIANGTNALVIGTGDLSELALGWATYNGDHMSNYGVNGGVPKTLVRYIVSWYADVCAEKGDDRLASVLRDILATPVSPELLPPKDGDIAQRTEDIVGPYDLHDFFLFHFVRWGEDPEKIRREAIAAWGDVYPPEVIDAWLPIFMRRFFTQQFKRSALPDGPKVGTVSLSPRTDWHMPSDAVPWKL